MEYFHQILLAYIFLHCLDTGIQNKDKASPSISVTGNGKLVKMRITFEPHGLFLSKFFCLFFLFFFVIYFKLHRNRDMLNDNKVKHGTNESIKGFYPISV